jgi:hypothetical protein
MHAYVILWHMKIACDATKVEILIVTYVELPGHDTAADAVTRARKHGRLAGLITHLAWVAGAFHRWCCKAAAVFVEEGVGNAASAGCYVDGCGQLLALCQALLVAWFGIRR